MLQKSLDYCAEKGAYSGAEPERSGEQGQKRGRGSCTVSAFLFWVCIPHFRSDFDFVYLTRHHIFHSVIRCRHIYPLIGLDLCIYVFVWYIYI